MPHSLLLATALVTVALGALVYLLAGALQPVRSRSVANLRRGLDTDVAEVAAVQDGGLAAFAQRITPPSLVAMLDRQHSRAGRPSRWPIGRLLVLKLLWIPTVALLALLIIASGQSPLVLLLLLVTAVVVYFVPELLLLSRGQERDQKVQLELADTLDQMTIAVEAGLGFDAAMARAATNGKGALAEELTRTLQDIRMGRSRRDAFEDLGNRSQVADLKQFVRAILQADAHGIAVGDVLRLQAAEMRMKRRQRAEEKAQQVPVKVLMPLMLCILPVLFIVVLAPAAMDMAAAFGSL